VLLEVLSSLGPVGNFFFGFTAEKLWSMIEGMQMIAMYPIFRIEAPPNLGLLQAVMRKISTFELIDDTYLKKYLWKIFDEEEGIDHFLLEAGIDSRLFMFTFGLPLYILAIAIPIMLVLVLAECLQNPEWSGRLAVLKEDD
jgi:hypothetical protein